MTVTAREPVSQIIYNGKEISAELKNAVQSIAFHFYLHGQANDLDISFKDGNLEFANDLYPQKGDTIEAAIGYSDGEAFNCGSFFLDETSFDLYTRTVTLRGTSTEVSKNFYESQYREYSGTLKSIVQKVADRNKLKLEGDIENLNIGRKSQSNSDLEFLNELADLYGYMFKIEKNILYFKPWEKLRTQDPVFTVEAENLMSGSYLNDSDRVYQWCEATYSRKGSTTKQKVEDSRIKNGLILKIEARSETEAQSKAEAKAALTKANLDAVSGVFSFEGNTDIYAGSIIELKNAGHLNGNYCVKSGTHEISDGDSPFTTTVEVFALL